MQASKQLRWMIALSYLLVSFPIPGHAEHMTIPLGQHKEQHTSHVTRSNDPSFNAINPLEFGVRHWWYGNFSIGDSTNLSLLIDTASGIIGINPGRYKPSPASIDLHKAYDKSDIDYGTQLKDGCGTAGFKGKGYMDTLTLPGGLVIENQAFASFVEEPRRPQTKRFPHDGIAGLSFGGLNHIGWFQKLCKLPQLKECRIGLALGTAGVGQQILGGVDHSLFDDDLTTITTSLDPSGWPVEFVVNGTKTIAENSTAGQFDTGTANIIGPADEVEKIFDAVGIQTVEYQPGWNNCTKKVIVGYYPCNKPPEIGIRFLNTNSSTNEVFPIEPEAFQMTKNGNNNCTAIVTGQYDRDDWTMGQAFFQGKYVDLNWEGLEHSVAVLKDKTVGAGATKAMTRAIYNAS